jgi:hypothetical protein
MAKDKISDYSSTANSNTDIAGINIDEGCAPSGINDAIRTLMAQLKTWQSGGQDVYIHPAGSASAPSITANGDTNTGIFFPAADTVGITTGGTERARVDSAGNLGLGVTPSAWSGSYYKVIEGGDSNNQGALAFQTSANGVELWANSYFDGTNSIYKYTGTAGWYQVVGNYHKWYVAPSGTAGNAITFTQAMTLDASGNLGVGTTSPTTKLAVSGGIAGTAGLNISGAGWGVLPYVANSFVVDNNGGETRFFATGANSTTDGSFLFYTSQTDGGANERARIDSSGNLLVGATATTNNARMIVEGSSSDDIVRIRNTNATPYGLLVNYPSLSPNSTVSGFLECYDSAGQRATIRSNGGLANYSANNVNLSDRREKTNFSPAGDYLAKICAIPVQTYNYIDQNLEEDGGLTLGVVAQDVQAVAPELVMESNWAGKDEEPKMRLSIYQTDLQYALMKCIQEQQAIIETLTARITALEQA